MTTIHSNFNISSMNFTIVDDNNNVTISSNYVTPIRMTDYDCDITFSNYSCRINIYGRNTGYDSSVDCKNDFACQSVVINANNDPSDDMDHCIQQVHVQLH